MVWIAESTWTTAVSVAGGEVVGYDCTIEPNFSQGWQEYLTAGTDNRYIQGQVAGQLDLNYTMSFVPYNWKWMKYLMAVADSTDGATKTHTFTMRDTIMSYTLEWARRHTTNHVLTLTSNAIKNATLSFAKPTGEGSEGFVKVALDCLAYSIAEGSSVASVSAISGTPFTFKHVKVTIDGTEYKEVNNGDMTISNEIDPNDSRYCNTTYSNKLGEPIPKVFRISGRFNINIKDKTVFNLWNAGTAVSGTCTLLLDRDGTGNDQILFTFTNFVIRGAVGGTNLDGVTTADVVWVANSFASVVARDSVSSY